MRSTSVFLAVALALTVALQAGTARADLDNEVHNGVKGAVGLGLLGADITLIIEGAVGVKNPWLLSVIPIVVAGGGAAGGYFIGRESAAASVALLVSGLALMVPAAILVAYGRSYRPSRDEGEGFVDRTEEGLLPDDHDYGAQEQGTTTEVLGPNDEEGVAPPPPPAEGGDEGAGDEGPAGAEQGGGTDEALEAFLRGLSGQGTGHGIRRAWWPSQEAPLFARTLRPLRLSLKYF
jgi:hypothetical protein